MPNSLNRIAIIDDEESIRKLLQTSLRAKGFEVGSAANAQEGFELIRTTHPHLVILDLGLPDQPGLEILKKLRDWSTVPVIVLTVSDGEMSKVALLEAGADDYLTKPFSVPELIARIKVALRHRLTDGATPVFKSDELEVDLAKRTVFCGGKSVKLTATEYQVLKFLIRNAGQVVSQDHLLSEIWGANAHENSHYLRIYIGHLRKKLERNPSTPRHIITEPGVGYRII